MIPRHLMQTTKKHSAERLRGVCNDPVGFNQNDGRRKGEDCRGTVRVAVAAFRRLRHRTLGAKTTGFVVMALILSACEPPGPRAVLEGKKLLDRGEYAQAIEQLQTATALMPTNALAFNYLGLALHEAGKPAEAERAYLRALTLDHDLIEVRFDLGCLLLSQSNRVEQAKSEITAYTMRRPNAADGWVKLGQAQLRLRELAAAERSFEEAVRLEPRNPEALTGMGLVRYQRRKLVEAAQCFAQALKERSDYGPALLNSAVVAQELNDARLALQRYREYVALRPPPENVQAVGLLVRQLEQQLNPPPRELPITNVAVQTIAGSTNNYNANTARVVTAELIRQATASKPPPPTNTAHSSPPVRAVESPTNIAKAASVPPATHPPLPQENLPVVHLAADPVIKPAYDPVSSVDAANVSQPDSTLATSLGPTGQDSRLSKRGFFQRINPINLFAHDGKTSTDSTSPTLVASATTARTDGSGTNPAAPSEPKKFPRYTYLSPEKPSAGDRSAAQQPFSQGVQFQQSRRFAEAVQSYRRAVQLDPSFYDAQYNLGLAAAENGSLSMALSSYEWALAIEPESLDARYNFALVLKRAGYVPDAVTQFEKILAQNPNDARTHLALGNLYAQQLQDVPKARKHYQEVLAVAPQSPQAGAILYWLSDHPR